MNSEQYHIKTEELSAIVAMSAEQLLPALNKTWGPRGFYDDANTRYFGALGAGEYMRDLYRDSTEARDAYAHATYIAAYNMHHQYTARRENPNTQLPNTVALEESFANMANRLKPGQSLVVLRIDMDRFKAVNSLGYDRGTQVLRDVGLAMTSVMRANSDILVHLGQEGEVDLSNPHGDEFVALMVVDTNPVDKPISSEGGESVPDPQEGLSRKAKQREQFRRRIEQFLSVKDRTEKIMERFEEEVQEILEPVAAEVNQARVGLNTRDISLGISIGYAIRGENEELNELLNTANDELSKVKDRKRQEELDLLEPDSRALANLSALSLSACGLNPDRIVEKMFGEGGLSVEQQIGIIEKGMRVLRRNLRALREPQQEQ